MLDFIIDRMRAENFIIVIRSNEETIVTLWSTWYKTKITCRIKLGFIIIEENLDFFTVYIWRIKEQVINIELDWFIWIAKNVFQVLKWTLK